MEWIERIERKDGQLVPIYVDETGSRRPGSVNSASLRTSRTDNKIADIKRLDLTTLTRQDASIYLEGLGMHSVDPSGHDVFSFKHGDDQFFVPVVTLMSGLIARLSAHRERLLEGASLPRVAIPAVVDNALVVRFARKHAMPTTGDKSAMQRRFTWLTCYPSARRMWGSIHMAATQGRLGMVLPLARVDVAIGGHRSGNRVFVTRFAVKTVYPDEAPLPFAAPYVAGPYEVYQAIGNVEQLVRFRQSANLKGVSTIEDDIPRGQTGYAMSDADWRAVRVALQRRGLPVQQRSKDKFNISLEKYGFGRTWASMGANKKGLQSNHHRWVRDGRWAALKAALRELRGRC